MTTLADNNYREQPELKCCQNCKHGHENSDWEQQWLECVLTNYPIVNYTSVCDKYEPRQ